ncbi:hypothetical protein EU805_01270 [Salipiger sp. IMCC34102]|uniref:LPS assembly lipoprotein LptE n=1 Tax=Salipiger sp. IMCC34102 TaxID=2510647 RepID=UPI00101BC3A9|nr:LPS assembly lipoprotein LptE [Salipiger sp. IMCC34102]RYH04031.1 hypothetical protein EU805_01270 [Salipiger sp. IMCC34102]
MSSDRTLSRRGAVLTLLALGACGFSPALAPGGAARSLQGRVSVTAPDTIEGFALRARLQERLGRGPGDLQLIVDIEEALEAAARSRRGDTLRYNVIGAAGWQLLGPDGQTLGEGQVDGFTSYGATGSTVATQTSATDAQGRLMTLLADRIFAQLVLLDVSS